MGAVGSIVAGFSAFLGVMITLSGMPVVGVIVGLVGGVIAGYTIGRDANQSRSWQWLN